MPAELSLESKDRLWSRWIRLRARDRFGSIKCVTCSAVVPWKQIQCGHFIPRGYLNTRFDPNNCHPQCHSCNVFLNGNLKLYRIFLNNLKAGLPEELEKKSKDGPVYEPDWAVVSSEVKAWIKSNGA